MNVFLVGYKANPEKLKEQFPSETTEKLELIFQPHYTVYTSAKEADEKISRLKNKGFKTFLKIIDVPSL